ncbi:kinase [Candidatus Thioglobus sp.]|nr:kinase [Candidatus Thioglobus sp.]
MIITKTPYRVSFFGGGTDYPNWFKENGGAVLGTSISHYCYIHGRIFPPFFNYNYRIVWSKIEEVMDLNQIEHPVIREALKWKNYNAGMEIHHNGDLPARSGLGSSSSFSIGLLHMLYALNGELPSKKKLTQDAIFLEQSLLSETVGIQDQILACHGGFNKIKIKKSAEYSLEPIVLTKQRVSDFEGRILLFYTGVSRFASNIAKKQVAGMPKKISEMHEMQKMVDVASDILLNGNDLDDFGRLLHQSWKLKRSLEPSIAPGFVNDIYKKAIRAGALGGKLLGAGGGGFMMFYVNPEMKQSVLSALNDLLLVPFGIDYNGTELMYTQSNTYSKVSMNRSVQFERKV